MCWQIVSGHQTEKLHWSQWDKEQSAAKHVVWTQLMATAATFRPELALPSHTQQSVRFM